MSYVKYTGISINRIFISCTLGISKYFYMSTGKTYGLHTFNNTTFP